MFVDVPQSGKDKGAAAPLISRYRYRRSRICARPPTAAPRRDVTDMIPCGALSRGRSFVNYFADRVIRCGENWERGDRWWSMGGKGRDTAWVCVWRRPCWRDTAGYPPRPQLGSAARRQELPLARPTFYTAQRRAAMHDARHEARCTHSLKSDISTPSISIRFTLAGWDRSPEKRLAPATVRSKWSPTTVGYCSQPHVPLRAKNLYSIHICIQNEKSYDELMIYSMKE